MSNWINKNFDIDLWISLAADNPYKFETQRKQWLEEAIEAATPEQQPRLNGLLWEMQIDLTIAKNKFNNCRSISRRLVENLKQLKEILAGELPYINKYPANIIKLPSRRGEVPI